MVCTRWAKASLLLLALQRALAILVSLVILLSLIVLLDPGAQFSPGESGPLGAAMDGGSGDPGDGSDSPGSYVAFDLLWELPAQGPNVSEASRAGLKNESGLGNISWPLMKRPEFTTLLKERLTGVDKRCSSAEDTEAEPSTEGMASTARVDAKTTWAVFIRAFLVAVVFGLIGLLLLKVVPAWTKDIKE
ncbi:hypothetical protein Nmel_018577 [Mimus melanotis]